MKISLQSTGLSGLKNNGLSTFKGIPHCCTNIFTLPLSDLFSFVGNEVLWLEFDWSPFLWFLSAGYPQSISTKYGPISPPAVDATECDVELQIAYLLHESQLYSYSWLEDTTLKEHMYTFVSMVDMILNDVNNHSLLVHCLSLPMLPDTLMPCGDMLTHWELWSNTGSMITTSHKSHGLTKDMWFVNLIANYRCGNVLIESEICHFVITRYGTSQIPIHLWWKDLIQYRLSSCENISFTYKQNLWFLSQVNSAVVEKVMRGISKHKHINLYIYILSGSCIFNIWEFFMYYLLWHSSDCSPLHYSLCQCCHCVSQ